MIKDQMEKIYGEMSPGDIPWNIETPPEILQGLITNDLLRPCKVIEPGCGIGNYVIYFAKNGFDATGMDISENAIDMAFVVVLGNSMLVKDSIGASPLWGRGKPARHQICEGGGMKENVDKELLLLRADMKVDRQFERLDDVGTLTEIIHYYREKGARSREIAVAIVKFVKEG